MRRSRRARLGWLVPMLLAALPASRAKAGANGDPESCTGDTGERLQFLEGDLDDKRTYADRWWKAWSAVYVAGIAVEGTSAGLADDSGARADHVVSAAKAGIGLTHNLLRPPPARLGTRDLEQISTRTEDGCTERLARAEAILRENAEASRKNRFAWKPHLANLALNLGGAVIVAEGFHEPRGWASGAVGLAVGELRIWTYPWQADGAWKEYQRRFPASGVPQEPATSWHIEPSDGGARLVVDY